MKEGNVLNFISLCFVLVPFRCARNAFEHSTYAVGFKQQHLQE